MFSKGSQHVWVLVDSSNFRDLLTDADRLRLAHKIIEVYETFDMRHPTSLDISEGYNVSCNVIPGLINP